MKRIFTVNAIFIMFAAALLVGTLGSADAADKKDTEKKEKPTLNGQLGHVLRYYADIQALLAADSTKGLAEASSKLSKAAEEAAKLAGKDKKLEKSKELVGILRDVTKSAGKLGAEKIELSEARETFKGLSASAVTIAEEYIPEKERSDYKIFYCEMAEAKWMQIGEKTRNPYYGKEMLTCGEMISHESGDAKKGHEEHEGNEGHMGHGGHMMH